MDKKILPKGIRELTMNEDFRNTMIDIVQESQSYYSGSKVEPKVLTNEMESTGFTMKFQDFVDDWSNQNKKSLVKNEKLKGVR